MNFPESTYFAKRMPKEKFYSNLELSPSLKRSFVEDIDYFIWRNKLSPSTVNISEGDKVKEIAIFEVYLKKEDFDPAILSIIDRSVPVYVVYLLRFENKVKLYANYKEASASKAGAFKLLSAYHTEWIKEEEATLRLDGLNLDTVYESFIRQIEGGTLIAEQTESLSEDIEKQKHRAKIEKQIAQLQAKKRKEPQFNKQIAISAEIKKLKEML